MWQVLYKSATGKYKGQVSIVLYDYPLTSVHGYALREAIAANCLYKQEASAYWEAVNKFHGGDWTVSEGVGKREGGNKAIRTAIDALGAERHLDEKALNLCVEEQASEDVYRSINLGHQLGVESTPTLWVNGEKVIGALSEKELSTLFDRILGAAR